MLKMQTDQLRQQYDDLRWAMHDPEIQAKYIGEVIVVRRRQVVAHGHDEGELLAQALRENHPQDELVFVEVLPADFEVPPDFD